MLAGNYSKMSAVQLRAGDITGALVNAKTAVGLQDQVVASDPKGVPGRISMAEFEARVGAVHLALAGRPHGRAHWHDGADWYRKAVTLYDALASEGNLRSPGIRREAAEARTALERCDRELAGMRP